MGVPSGSFSDPRSGRLQVTFQLRPLVDGAEFAGGDWDVRLRCIVNDGVQLRTLVLRFREGSARLELDYVGGTTLTFSIVPVSHAFDGFGEVTADRLVITVRFWAFGGGGTGPEVEPTFEGLLNYMMAQLQPMSGSVQPEPGDDDTFGDEYFVLPRLVMATISRARNGFLNEFGRGTITDEDEYQIAEETCVAWSTERDGTGYQAMTATVLPGGSQVRIAGGIPDGLWYLTYKAAPPGDGLSFETAWPGLEAIPAGVISPSDTLWVCGVFEDQQFTLLDWAGEPGAYIKIRLDHPLAPGTIYNARRIAPSSWVAVGDGEFYLPEYTTSNNMLFEDGERLVGPSTTSLCKQRVRAIYLGSNAIDVQGERAIFTGMPIHIAQDVPAERLPSGLQFSKDRGGPYYARVTAITGTTYTIQLCDTPADAAAGVPVPLVDTGDGENWFVWITSATHGDPLPGALLPGQYGYDPVLQRLYYRPSTGSPADHEVRISSDKAAETGVCIYGINCSYLRILGGGRYGGLFGDTPAPAGSVGLAHLNAIQFEGPGSHIIVDGLKVHGCRSAVAFKGQSDCVSRNNRIFDVGWHASGGEGVDTAEPRLLQERNWISDVGLKHDFGDLQGLVTNPGCHDSITRRNFLERIGRDSQYVNTGALVIDSSDRVSAYLNWGDQIEGEFVEFGSGPDGAVNDAVIMSNVLTRHGTRPAAVRENARQCFVGIFVALDYGAASALVAGNLVANSKFLTSQIFTAEPVGMLLLRSANTSQANELHTATRNAVYSCDGNVYALKTTGSPVPPAPTFESDENLFLLRPTGAFYTRDLAAGPDASYSRELIQGGSAGYWSFDTGNDVASQVGEPARRDFNTPPTRSQLELLRLYDAFDTLDPPTLAMVGDFPLLP